jgi:hypothetical protein
MTTEFWVSRVAHEFARLDTTDEHGLAKTRRSQGLFATAELGQLRARTNDRVKNHDTVKRLLVPAGENDQSDRSSPRSAPQLGSWCGSRRGIASR